MLSTIIEGGILVSRALNDPSIIRASLMTQREMIKVRLEAMSDPETAKLLAKFSRVYFEALIKEGFSDEEAMQLVKSVLGSNFI